jgi:ribokinase
MSKVFVIGDLYKETQFHTSKIPTENEFVVAESATTYFGSKSLNAARVFSKLGEEVHFFCAVGDDDLPSTDALKDFELSPIFAKKKNQQTGQIHVLTTPSGQSAVTLFRGANDLVTVEDIKNIESEIQTSAYLYTTTSLPLSALYTLVELAFTHQKPLFLDVPNRHDSLDLSKLQHVTFFAPNRQETEKLCQTTIAVINDAKQAASKLNMQLQTTILITLDKDGCLICQNGQSTHFPTTEMHPVDSTAAGDIFRAVFMKFWMENKNVDEAIQQALKTATQSVKIKGVSQSIEELFPT